MESLSAIRHPEVRANGSGPKWPTRRQAPRASKDAAEVPGPSPFEARLHAEHLRVTEIKLVEHWFQGRESAAAFCGGSGSAPSPADIIGGERRHIDELRVVGRELHDLHRTVEADQDRAD